MTSRSPSVRLTPLSEAERDRFLDEEVARYAESKSRAGYWTPEEALGRSRAEIRGLVGDRPEARGHRFLKAVDGSGRDVGWVWVGPLPGAEGDRRSCWLFEILVAEGLRGRGYGRALLRATEAHLRTEGFQELGLNVWVWNRIAFALYTSAGYDLVARDDRSIEMRKRLGPT